MSKLLLYCTKNKWRLFFDTVKQVFTLGKVKSNNDLNGKIVVECDFDVEEIKYCHIKERDEFGILHNEAWQEYRGLNITDDDCDLASKSCLTTDEIFDYLLNKNGYAIHIKNLHIFDKPRELSEYHNNNSSPIEKAPQNMMYARQTVPFKKEFLVKGILQEVRGYKVNEYILISIQPQWLCLILNRIKDVEVRKVVLKEMLNNGKSIL